MDHAIYDGVCWECGGQLDDDLVCVVCELDMAEVLNDFEDLFLAANPEFDDCPI